MAFRKLVGSYKDYNLATHIIESGYLAVDVDTGSLRIGDGSTPGGTVIATPSGGGSQNVFQTIAVSGQSNVVADSTTDTLTLVAGTNVTLTTDASADTITINSSGGGGGSTDLNSLSAGVIDTQNDSIGFIDANDSNNSKKETITDFLTAIAGSGISVSSGQLTA